MGTSGGSLDPMKEFPALAFSNGRPQHLGRGRIGANVSRAYYPKRAGRFYKDSSLELVF